MAIIGVSKPYYSKYSSTGSQVEYTGGGVLGKATEVDVEINTSDDNNLYADNAVAETDRSFAGGTLTVGTDDLSQEVTKVILGVQEQAVPAQDGSEATELVFDDRQVTPYLGVGFIIKKQKSNQLRWRAVVFPKVMFAVPNDSATTQGETIEWQTPELSGTIMRDDTQFHAWKREATFSTETQAEAYIKGILNITDQSEPPQTEIGGEEEPT